MQQVQQFGQIQQATQFGQEQHKCHWHTPTMHQTEYSTLALWQVSRKPTITTHQVFSGFISAAANETHIFAFNNAADEVVIWERDWTTVSTTITPNSPTNQYRGLAVTDTHLVLLNHTENQLEYYLLTDYSYVSALTVSLDSRAWGGAARGADYLFLGNNSDDDIERRALRRNSRHRFQHRYKPRITVHLRI